VQHQLVGRANRVNRGVRQAGFLVLREVAMPSVLIELGFISNREEERFMMSTEGQRTLANSIYEGFRQYLADHRRRTHLPGAVVQPQQDTPVQPITTGVREFRIQFLSSGQRHNDGAAIFRGLSPVSFYREGNVYRFTYGSASCREEISRLLPRVRQKFNDAFIIEMIDGQRVR